MSKEPKQIRTEIIIKASPSTVWSILTDFDQFPVWNPFIKSIEGKPQQGSKVKARIAPPGGSEMTFNPTILSSKQAEELKWLGQFIFPGLFDGEHIFELYENTDGSTTFIQREIFSGLLVPLFGKMIDVNTLQGFKLMNAALKDKAEQNIKPNAQK